MNIRYCLPLIFLLAVSGVVSRRWWKIEGGVISG